MDGQDKDSLYELCKEVYEKTGWTVGDESWEWHTTIDAKLDSMFIAPKYYTDYLLEKLPGYIALTSTTWDDVHVYKKDSELDYQACACYQSNVKGKLIQKVADTPLKALLKLTIALSEAGELK